MARALSQVYTIIRGSVGGLTYLSNQFHQIVIRARTAPVQPNTTLQTAVRSSMTAANNAWLNLTDVQRNAWDQYATGLPWPGPLGSYTVTGRLCMMAMKILREFIETMGYAVPTGPDTAPNLLMGFYNLSNVKATTFTPVSDTGVSVQYTTEAVDDCLVLAELSPPFPVTRMRYKGPWDTSHNQVDTGSAPSSNVIDFGGLNDGAVYFIRLRAVSDDAPGRISPEFIIRAIAVTNGP